MRCALNADGSRELCHAGQWSSASACADTEVCIADGQCQPIAKVCRGNAGRSACDGAQLNVCNQDGTIAAQQTCNSERQCQVGLAARECARCEPGEHRCSGAMLERCSDDGGGWTPGEVCESAALCNADARACTSAVCLAGQYKCDADRLLACNADQTAFEDVRTCDPGTCSAEAGDCLICVPDKKGCDGTRAQTCRADGSGWDGRACSGLTPLCAEASGQCVQCTGASKTECAAPLSQCREAYCDVASASCLQRLAAEGASCPRLFSTGHCDRWGYCNECLTNDHCRGATGRPFCNALTGFCSECATDAQCDRANFEACSLYGQCYVTAGCGNRQIDYGEECDATASNWTDETCDPNTCRRRIFLSCGGRGCARSGDSCGDAGVCTPGCGSAAECPRFPGHTTECSDAGRCYLPCSGEDDTSCPSGLVCRTDLSPDQCGARQ